MTIEYEESAILLVGECGDAAPKGTPRAGLPFGLPAANGLQAQLPP
jgi:hypothetical protein